MPQIIAVTVFLFLAIKVAMEAAANGFVNFPAKVATGVFFSYGFAVALRFALVKILDVIDPRFEVTTPLVTDMNRSRAYARVYSVLRNNQLLSLSTDENDDWISGSWGHVYDYLGALLFLTPWELFTHECGESMDVTIDFQNHPQHEGCIVYINFQTTVKPRGLRLYSIWIRARIVKEVKDCLRARSAPELPRRGSSFQDADVEYEKGKEAAEDRDFEIALAHFKKAIEIRGDSHYYWESMADTLFEMQMYQEARMAYKEASQLNPGEGYNFQRIAWTYYEEDSIGKALENVRHAIKIGYDNQYSRDLLQKCEERA